MLVKSELAKVRRERSAQAQAAPTLPIDEAKLRREIEAEVRAKIATEQQQMTNRSSNDSQNYSVEVSEPTSKRYAVVGL